MSSKKNIVLVGFMGTGKTACGRLLAERLGYRLREMDAIIEERAGKKISAIFAEDGEPAFRAMERELVRELAGEEGQVIAAGGGIVLQPENIRDFERNGVVVCLRATPEEILDRVRADQHRPLLEEGEKAQRIRELLEQRKPLYDAVPHQVDTTGHTPEQVADAVLETYRSATR